MIGIAVEIILSWIILKYFGYTFKEAFGLTPTKRRLRVFVLGIIFSILFHVIFRFTTAWLVHNPYYLNPEYSAADFLIALAYVARAVLFEELIFRGALLYVLMQKIGNRSAFIISCAAFGIYHWFAWQAFGNPMQMLIIFFMTASCGYVFALAYVRTRSVFLPCALHFGNNVALMILFSRDKAIGDQLLLKVHSIDPVVPSAIISIPVLILHFTGFQLLGWYFVTKIARK